MKDTIPNENFRAYNIFTFEWVHLKFYGRFYFSVAKNASAGTISEDLVICYLTKSLLNDVNNVAIPKICLLFTAKMLLDFNEYLSFYEHISLTAVPRMLRATRHFFHIALFMNIFFNFHSIQFNALFPSEKRIFGTIYVHNIMMQNIHNIKVLT